MNTKDVLKAVRDAVSSHTGCEKELYEELDAEADGCDECTDHYCGDEYGDEPHGPPEFGCCLPLGECCMPGLHFPSECHTAADYERAHPLTVGE